MDNKNNQISDAVLIEIIRSLKEITLTVIEKIFSETPNNNRLRSENYECVWSEKQ